VAAGDGEHRTGERARRSSSHGAKEEEEQPWLAACQVFDEMPKRKKEG
jgi:hypothetical protein